MKKASILLAAALAVGTTAMMSPAVEAGAAVDPRTYLATLQFDGKDWMDTGEQNFPQPFRFQSYDTNIEHNKENMVRFKIGSNVIGTGSTGWANRGPNDQRPAVYFHFLNYGGSGIYQYFLYYPDNHHVDEPPAHLGK